MRFECAAVAGRVQQVHDDLARQMSRGGRIVGRIIGMVNKAEVIRRVEWLLGDRQASAPPPLINTVEKHPHDHGHEHGHEGEEEHHHASVGLEGASTVPS